VMKSNINKPLAVILEIIFFHILYSTLIFFSSIYFFRSLNDYVLDSYEDAESAFLICKTRRRKNKGITKN
jgi:hypothetical protein